MVFLPQRFARDLPASSKFVFGQIQSRTRELKRGGQRNNQYPAPLSPPCALLDGWGVKGRCCLPLLGSTPLTYNPRRRFHEQTQADKR